MAIYFQVGFAISFEQLRDNSTVRDEFKAEVLRYLAQVRALVRPFQKPCCPSMAPHSTWHEELFRCTLRPLLVHAVHACRAWQWQCPTSSSTQPTTCRSMTGPCERHGCALGCLLPAALGWEGGEGPCSCSPCPCLLPAAHRVTIEAIRPDNARGGAALVDFKARMIQGCTKQQVSLQGRYTV